MNTSPGIERPSAALRAQLQRKIDLKTKPVGSLGVLEGIAQRLGEIQQTLTPQVVAPTVLVFAADHGLVHEGVSAYPQEVTHQMVYNFVQGGAAINVFARQHGARVVVVDAGVHHDFAPELPIVHAKVAAGTANAAKEPAMTQAQLDACFERGAQAMEDVLAGGCTLVGFGEMGIGNTSSSALLMSALCGVEIEACVGRGTGLDDEGLERKTAILRRVLALHGPHLGDPVDPMEALRRLGGFEIAQMAAAMLHGARRGVALVVDGFISTAAMLVASKIDPAVLSYAFFAHQSDEQGHRLMLQHLGAQPLLRLGMRLGEGSGAVLAFGLFESAVAFLEHMASFEGAGVSQKDS